MKELIILMGLRYSFYLRCIDILYLFLLWSPNCNAWDSNDDGLSMGDGDGDELVAPFWWIGCGVDDLGL